MVSTLKRNGSRCKGKEEGRSVVCQEMHVIWGFRTHIFECVCVAVANTVNSTRAETITTTRF